MYSQLYQNTKSREGLCNLQFDEDLAPWKTDLSDLPEPMLRFMQVHQQGRPQLLQTVAPPMFQQHSQIPNSLPARREEGELVQNESNVSTSTQPSGRHSDFESKKAVQIPKPVEIHKPQGRGIPRAVAGSKNYRCGIKTSVYVWSKYSSRSDSKYITSSDSKYSTNHSSAGSKTRFASASSSGPTAVNCWERNGSTSVSSRNEFNAESVN
jgi:hypothetical protein